MQSVLPTAFSLFLVTVLALSSQVRASDTTLQSEARAYSIALDENGTADVALASGEVVFANARPMVWLDGEKEPHPLAVGRISHAQQPFRDRLAEGEEIAI
jgi:hypothetical protein